MYLIIDYVAMISRNAIVRLRPGLFFLLIGHGRHRHRRRCRRRQSHRCLSSGATTTTKNANSSTPTRRAEHMHARTRSVYHSYIHTCACARASYISATALYSWRMALRYVRTRTYIHNVNPVAPVGHTDVHACVTSSYLFGHVCARVLYINTPQVVRARTHTHLSCVCPTTKRSLCPDSRR